MSETPGEKRADPAPRPSSNPGAHSSQDANRTIFLPKGDSGAQNPLLREQDAALGQALATLPNYEVLGKLGEGGMGAVYSARQLTLDRLVAIKVLPKQLSGDAKYAARLHREARVLAKLNHPHVIGCYDVGEHQGILYVVMEFVAGESLFQTLSKRGSLPLPEALAYLKQAVLGLDHANALGIVHRDIKPENLLLAKVLAAGTTARLQSGYTLKIADLGLAAYTEENSQNTRLTMEGSAVGSPHYMSPEQTLGEHEIDFRTDMYALGATLYHMLTGKTPYEGTTVGAVLAKKLSESIPDPRAVRPELPPGVALLIQKMTARKKENRYSTYGDLLRDIEALEEQRALAAKILAAGDSSLALLPETLQALRDQGQSAPAAARAPGSPKPGSQGEAEQAQARGGIGKLQIRRTGVAWLAGLMGLALLGLFFFTRGQPPLPAPVKTTPAPAIGPPANPPEATQTPRTSKRPAGEGGKTFEARALIEERSTKGWGKPSSDGVIFSFEKEDDALSLQAPKKGWCAVGRELPGAEFKLHASLMIVQGAENCELQVGLGGPDYIAFGIRFPANAKKAAAYLEKRSADDHRTVKSYCEQPGLDQDAWQTLRIQFWEGEAACFLNGMPWGSVELDELAAKSQSLRIAVREGIGMFRDLQVAPRPRPEQP